ncbi:ArnT family glycosyltransferase [Leptothrix sp. BB-4]
MTHACARYTRLTRRDLRLLLAWALLLLVLQLAGLGTVPLFDVDEGAFSEATRELLASGDWGHTTLNGEDRWDKPILTYWLQAGSVALFGLDEFTLRLPSALAAWLWAVCVAHRVSQSHGMRAGLAAGTLLATSLGVALIGRAATADALLNLWLALSMLSLWSALRDLAPDSHEPADAARRPAGLRALRLSAVWIALGLLTKGPVALLVPGATVALWSAATALQAGRHGAATRLWRTWRPLLSDGPAWALLVGLALPWYAYALHRHGMAFVEGFLWRHNLQRYGGALEGHDGAWSYYLVLLPLLMLPWSALLLPLLARLRPLWRDPADRYLLTWAGFVLVFFSASGTKLPHYLLYGLTPLAMLAGRLLTQPQTEATTRWSSPIDRLAEGALLACLAALPLLALVMGDAAQARLATSTRPDDALLRLLLAGPGLLDGEAGQRLMALAGIGGLLLAGGAWAGLRTALRPAGPLLAGLLLTLGLTQVVLPWWGERLQGPVRDLALAARRLGLGGQDERAPTGRSGVVQWGLHQPSFALYLGRPVPRRAPLAGEVALVRQDRLARLLADAGTPPGEAPRVLAETRGYALIRWPDDAPPR